MTSLRLGRSDDNRKRRGKEKSRRERLVRPKCLMTKSKGSLVAIQHGAISAEASTIGRDTVDLNLTLQRSRALQVEVCAESEAIWLEIVPFGGWYFLNVMSRSILRENAQS